MLALVLLLLFVAAAVFRIWILFAVVWILVLMLLALWWQRRSIRRAVQIERRVPERISAGNTLPVRLEIHNSSRLPVPALSIAEPAPFDLAGDAVVRKVMAVKPRSTVTLDLHIPCWRRGYHRLDAVTASAADVLGSGQAEVEFGHGQTVIVYPRIVPLARLGFSSHSPLVALPAPRHFTEDPARVVGIRPYQAGDPLRSVHWSASARSGALVVKQLQRSVARDTVICLDLHPDAYLPEWREGSEQAIVVAASIANHVIVREKQAVGLAFDGWDPEVNRPMRHTLPPGTGRGHLVAMLERLARVRVDRTSHFGELVTDVGVRLSHGSTVVLVTGRVDRELAANLLRLARRGHAVTLVLVSQDARASSISLPPSVQVRRVWEDLDLGRLA